MKKNVEAIVDKKKRWEKDWKLVLDRYFWRRRWHILEAAKYTTGRVLDLGCGAGHLAGFIQPNEAWYTGVDISEEAIEYGKMLFPASTFLVQDVENKKLPFEDSSFDTVVMTEVLEHLEHYHNVLAEALRVTKENIIATVPIDHPQPDHVYPEWSVEDVKENFGKYGKIVRIMTDYEYNFHLVWIRK